MDFGQSYLQSATNFIRIIKGRRREQSAAAFGAVCFLAATYLKSNQWIPNWKGYALAPIALTAIGVLAFAYAFRRLWRATHATDLPPVKDRPSVIKGPSAFTPGDGELFRRLGRESELQELMGYVLDNQTPLVVLMGESGAGKTSLLRAGLPHILKDKGVRVHYWEAVPTDSAERLLRAIQEDWSANSEKKPAELTDLINPSDALGAESHVIVLDQFEQLRGRNAVLQLLRRVTRESLPPHRLTWVVAFRREYRADWADFIIPENNKRGFYPKEMSLRLFTSEAARDVIGQLIQEAGLQVEQPVVNNLISAAANADNQVSPVDLGIGLLVLAELYDRLGGRTLTVKDYQFAGGAEGLLTQYINRCLERFAETEREPLLKALLALRDPDTLQRRAEGLPLDQLAAEAEADPRRLQPQLERLAQRDIRLLEIVTPKNAGKDSVTHYRLPHERLIPALHRLTGKLLGEIEQARLRFENAFLAWQKNDKLRRYLLKGKDLKLIEHNASQMPWGSAEQEKQNYLGQSLQRRSFVRMGTVAAAITLMFVSWSSALKYQQYEHQRYLRESGYPPELYDYQYQLKTLVMTEPLDLERFTWLSSDSIEELSLTALSSSNSIAGLESLSKCASLKKLTLGLGRSQVSNLESLMKLNHLTHLTLNISGAKISDLEPLSKLSNLKQLKLSLNSSQVRNLEPLSKLNNLSQLNLDLSYSKVSNMEPLSKLNNLTLLDLALNFSQVDNLESLSRLNNLIQLTLHIDSSKVSNLEPLSKLNRLTQLTLDLSGSRVSNLDPLSKLSSLAQLTLDLKYTHVSNLEALSKLNNITQLTLDSSYSKVGNLEPLLKLNKLMQLTLGTMSNLEPLPKLKNLTQLTLKLGNSPVSNLEPMAKLNNLIQLTLSLGSKWGTESPSLVSSLGTLPKLGDLTQLTLDLSKSSVSDLQPLAKLSKLAILEISTSYTQVRNLESLAKLSHLIQLTLDLDESQVSNLEPLAKLTSLAQLELNLGGEIIPSKVGNLEPLAKLSNLKQLTLKLGGGRKVPSPVSSLELLSKLNNLEQLTLKLGDHLGTPSPVSSLEPLSKLNNLRQLTLQLGGDYDTLSPVSSLEPLSKLSNLTQLTLLDLLGGQLNSLATLAKLPNLQKLFIQSATSAQRMSLQKLPPSVVELSF